jgi:hypothetical protein
MASHVGLSSQDAFHERRSLFWRTLGGQPREVPWILTCSLSKAIPGAYSTYRMQFVSCFILSMYVLIVHYV